MKKLLSIIICDECKQPINKNTEAMVEWIDDGVSISDVRIVHNPKFSPTGNCYKHSLHFYRKDRELDFILSNLELKNKLNII